MKTLKELVIERKCRKGPAHATTKKGAFWLAFEPIVLRRYGGDGIGQSGADCTNYLQLRHYRDGGTKAVVNCRSYHQNTGSQDEWLTVNGILDCQTAEEIIIALKAAGNEDFGTVLGGYYEDKLITALVELGLDKSAPSPDEEFATPSVAI